MFVKLHMPTYTSHIGAIYTQKFTKPATSPPMSIHWMLLLLFHLGADCLVQKEGPFHPIRMLAWPHQRASSQIFSSGPSRQIVTRKEAKALATHTTTPFSRGWRSCETAKTFEAKLPLPCKINRVLGLKVSPESQHIWNIFTTVFTQLALLSE